MIRFVHFFNYAKGVSIADGEAWYEKEHVPWVKKLPGVLGYRSWKALDLPFPLSAPAPFDQFVRISELGFANFQAARQAIVSNPTLWASSADGVQGFREFEGLLLDEEPQFNLLRDMPPQQYKYATLPMMWPSGVPTIEDTDDLVVDVYFFNYKPEVTTVDGEDWYLGHHTREGKQLPGLKRYQTWKGLRLAGEAALPFQSNRWFRLTHLGFPSFDAYQATMYGPQRLRFTPPPVVAGGVLGVLGVIGEWRNVFIRLDEVQDLLV